MNYYTQLTQYQRHPVYVMSKGGHTQTAIANKVGVHKSTINRELSRNTGLHSYPLNQAHQLTSNRKEDVIRNQMKELNEGINFHCCPVNLNIVIPA